MENIYFMKQIFIGIIFVFVCIVQPKVTSAQNNSKKPINIGEQVQLFSKVLNENRTLNIYLPEGYQENDTTHYPVIFLLDGSMDEDFIHIVGLVQYYTFPWIQRIPKSIVVGIANVDRRRDFTGETNIPSDLKHSPTGGHSANFIAFIEKELIPFMIQNYPTQNTRTIIGQSLGGLLATEILFTKPYLFFKYIIISPSLWWNDGALLKTQPDILNADFKQPIDIYIGVGKEGLSPSPINHVMEVDANLLAEKIGSKKNKNVTYFFDYLPEENHATVTHPAVFNAFKYLYPLNK